MLKQGGGKFQSLARVEAERFRMSSFSDKTRRLFWGFFVKCFEDNATMSSKITKRYYKNHVSYFVQN